MSVVLKLLILVSVALIATLGLIWREWRDHLLNRGRTGSKAALAAVLVGLLVSLLTHP
ncbi:hypothetical protein [Lacticaseibacillus daqingensis]|uniref:hypothetical protein n=1 Tax=Lacticaseibacillus daqingensis TaxID=2486014 RepID=UPI0013DE516A|nr:hypothetical protein [Lacticaseibacillus daqingensis]